MAETPQDKIPEPDRAVLAGIGERIEEIEEAFNPDSVLSFLELCDYAFVGLLPEVSKTIYSKIGDLWALVGLYKMVAQDQADTGDEFKAELRRAEGRGVAIAAGMLAEAFGAGLQVSEERVAYHRDQVICNRTFGAIVGDLGPEFAAIVEKLLGDSEDSA